jgi:hypothetical protein
MSSPSTVSAALTLALVAAACSTADEPARNEVRAYLTLARAICEREAECLTEGGHGQLWGSMEACAESRVERLSVRSGTVDCAPESDFMLEADELSACALALGSAACDVRALASNLVTRALSEELAACRPLAKKLAELEDGRAGAVPIGEPCMLNEQCTWDATCMIDDTGTCFVCQSRPAVGERCDIDPEGGLPICAAGLTCSGSTCVTGVPAEGEECGDGLGHSCADGLDCDADGKCAKLFEPGVACGSDEYYPCGAWLYCDDGTCVAPGPGMLGSACGPENLCLGGRCVDGKCAPLAKLGEPCPLDCGACDSDCLDPYMCVGGTCRDVPACGTGKPDDVCSTSSQCASRSCVRDANPVGHCSLQGGGGYLGEVCREEDGCSAGQCKDGRCLMAESGASCDDDYQCSSLACTDGRCAELLCE